MAIDQNNPPRIGSYSGNAESGPGYHCAAYNQMKPGWDVVQDVAKGTLHLREKGDIYLPKEPAEQPQDWDYRRKRAVFFNAFERTLHGLVGMVFRKEPQLGEDVPVVIRGQEGEENQAKTEGLAENIDNAGSHWTVFAKESFTEAMRDGHSFILVDMPPKLKEGSTLADEKNAGRRPYWVSYTADQAVNWRVEVIGGKTVLTQITFRECTYEADGDFGEREVVRYRVLNPGKWTLYVETKDGQGETTGIDIEGSGETSLNEIPLCVIYSRKTGFLTSRPPLLDMGLINICHWQKYNDYSLYLHICGRPILWFRGRQVPAAPQIGQVQNVQAIGPYTFFDVDAQNGQVAFAETSGNALGAAREDIKDLEGQMATMGMSIIASKQQQQPNTATEEKRNHVQEESDLATAARSLKDALELALGFTAQYLGQPSGGSVELGATIEELTLDPQEMQAYSGMEQNGQITLETLWAVMERAGKLPEDFNPAEERKKLDAQKQKEAEEQARIFNRGLMGDGPPKQTAATQ